MQRTKKRARRAMFLGAVLSVAFLLGTSATAFAATFSGASPANGASAVSPVTLSVEAFATHADPVFYYADLDPHLVLNATIAVDGGAPVAVTGVYAWEWFWYSPSDYDNTLGYNPGHATYTSSPLTLAPGSHSAVLKVAETPGTSTFTYTWSFSVPGSPPLTSTDCLTCHSTFPTAHPTANCALCHTASNSPVFSHSGARGVASVAGCSKSASLCHGGAANHTGSVLGAHVHYDLDSVANPRAATPCTDCHADKSAPHGGAAKTWNYQADYYSWGSYPGSGVPGVGSVTLGNGGTNVLANQNANPTAGGGVHSNYQTATAKCGICHSVHRAKAGGVKLLNTATATCAGCHISGTSAVTNVVIAWGTPAAPLAGPHSSTSGSCTDRACHATSPHGVGGSQYGVFKSKLLTAAVDAQVADAAANPASSGVNAALLTGVGANTDFTGAADAVRVGYTCASDGCHEQTQLPVIRAGWSELREQTYPLGNVPGNQIRKTGHLSVASSNATSAFTAATSCTGCHDQPDPTTRTGHTFPHAQRATGAGAGTQTYLWYNIAANTASVQTSMTNSNMKSFDGACLKCHRTATAGVGVTF